MKHPSYVMGAAVAVSLPMVPGILSGAISTTTAGERFLIALVVCWFFGSILGWVITTYSEQARRAEVMRIIHEARLEEIEAGQRVDE